MSDIPVDRWRYCCLSTKHPSPIHILNFFSVFATTKNGRVSLFVVRHLYRPLVLQLDAVQILQFRYNEVLCDLLVEHSIEVLSVKTDIEPFV
jgi:hypothetical protein